MQNLEDAKLIQSINKLTELARQSIMENSRNNNKLFDKVQEKGIELFGMSDKDYDGVTMWNKETKKPQIYLDVEHQNKECQLFTLTHELGHLFLDFNWTPYGFIKDEPNQKVLSIKFRDKNKIDDAMKFSEKIANEFAGAFLMPKYDVEDVISANMSDNEKISQVSTACKVTKNAAKNRLIVLNEITNDKK